MDDEIEETEEAVAAHDPGADIHLIWGFLLAQGELPAVVEAAIDRLRTADYAEAEAEVEEEAEEEEEVAKPKRTSNMSPENRAKAAHRMREVQARKKAEREGREFVPTPFVWPVPEGNGEAPLSGGAEPEGQP